MRLTSLGACETGTVPTSSARPASTTSWKRDCKCGKYHPSSKSRRWARDSSSRCCTTALTAPSTTTVKTWSKKCLRYGPSWTSFSKWMTLSKERTRLRRIFKQVAHIRLYLAIQIQKEMFLSRTSKKVRNWTKLALSSSLRLRSRLRTRRRTNSQPCYKLVQICTRSWPD